MREPSLFPQQGNVAGGPGEKQSSCGIGERDRYAWLDGEAKGAVHQQGIYDV